MKKLSYWAKANPWKARMIIVLTHLIISILAICFGILTYFFDWQMPQNSSFWLSIIVIVAIFFYPIKGKKTGWFKESFLRQKKLDFLFILSSFCLVAFSLNNFLMKPMTPTKTTNVRFISYEANQSPKLEQQETIDQTIKKRKHLIKKNIKAKLKMLKRKHKSKIEALSPIAKVGLIVLIIGLMFAGGVGVLWLYCNLFCSGFRVAAWLVLIAGWTFLLVVGITQIKHVIKDNFGKKKKKVD